MRDGDIRTKKSIDPLHDSSRAVYFQGSLSESLSSGDCSVLSLLSDSKEEEPLEQEPRVTDAGSVKLTVKRMEKKFERRKQKIGRLCTGRSQSYVKMMEAHEEAVYQVLVAKHRNRVGKSGDNRQFTDTTHASLLVQSWWMFLFEANHTLPASYVVLLVSMGHSTFYAFFDVVMRSSYHAMISSKFASSLSLDQYHAIEIIIGLVLIRLNGNIFYWQDKNSIHLANIEMHNRLKLNRWDALILKRLKGALLSSAMNMFGFYLVYLGLGHFYYSGLHSFVNFFYAWYDGFRKQAEQDLCGAVAVNTTTSSGESNDADYVRMVPTCDMLVEQVSPQGDWLDVDYHNHPQCYYFYYDQYQQLQEWLVHHFCMDETQEWRILLIVYHGFWLIVFSTLIAAKGDNILRYCDD